MNISQDAQGGNNNDLSLTQQHNHEYFHLLSGQWNISRIHKVIIAEHMGF